MLSVENVLYNNVSDVESHIIGSGSVVRIRCCGLNCKLIHVTLYVSMIPIVSTDTLLLHVSTVTAVLCGYCPVSVV